VQPPAGATAPAGLSGPRGGYNAPKEAPLAKTVGYEPARTTAGDPGSIPSLPDH
jgi:hypothetical protein